MRSLPCGGVGISLGEDRGIEGRRGIGKGIGKIIGGHHQKLFFKKTETVIGFRVETGACRGEGEDSLQTRSLQLKYY